MAKNIAKEVYKELRQLSVEELWHQEVPRFERLSPKERDARVGLVRAVGVVMAESGTEQQKAAAREWLVGLLQDPGEKIRRYAMAALPKLESGAAEEAALLSLKKTAHGEREVRFLEKSLNKLGGIETLKTEDLSPQTRQKVQAAVARRSATSTVDMQAVFPAPANLRIHLRCRDGLEKLVLSELRASESLSKKFNVERSQPGLLVLTVKSPFSLGEIYNLRSFASVGFVLGSAKEIEPIAALLSSSLAQNLFRTFTKGSIRYRLEFISMGHRRGAIREIANLVYAQCPDILNDASSAPWSVDLYPSGSVELRPRLVPDPRFTYRLQDVPAASHPPLAACLARIPGRIENEVIWDPFCGSGSELIESVLLGGVKTAYGTDLSEEAIAITRKNFAAAGLPTSILELVPGDFRDFANEVAPKSISLVITNPPLGQRVPVPAMRQLVADIFSASARVLKPGGRLVLINPLPMKGPHPAFELQDQHLVDLGGFERTLELYRRR